jgi:O-antigen/teichoic acid export membrane protein
MRQGFSMRFGTLGGVLTVILCNISVEELGKIALSAAIGTIVSVGVSFLMSKILKKQVRK